MNRKKIDKKKKKAYNMLDFVLLGILFSLIIVVVLLGVVAIFKANEKNEKTKVDMAVPVIEETTNSLFLDIGSGKTGDKRTYLLKVKNHYKDNINKEEYTYKISFTSDPDIKLALYEEGKNKNLLDPNTISTKEFTLKKDVRDEKIFEVKIELKEDTEGESLVYLDIEGKKKNGNSWWWYNCCRNWW